MRARTGLLTDFLCYLAVAIPILLFKEVGKPYHRGFYCTDQSINKPFKEGTVHAIVLYAVGFCFPSLVMIFTELFYYRRISPTEKAKDVRMFKLGLLFVKLDALVVRLFELIFVLSFGAAITILVTDVGKYSIGRLRPHFISVCEPDPAVVWNCTSTSFITADVCTGDPELIHKARLSFPSGHSSFSAYTMTVLVIYIEARMHFKNSRFLKIFLQLFAALLAILCGLSRVSDYKHHWSDVLAGLILGMIVAVIVVSRLFGWFKTLDQRKPTEKDLDMKSLNTVV